MIHRAFLVALLISELALAQSPPLEFKGVPVGSTEAELIEKYSAFDCQGEAPDRKCTFTREAAHQWTCRARPDRDRCYDAMNELLEFGPTSPTVYLIEIRDGRVGRVSIVFPTKDFGALEAALREKYGKPQASKVDTAHNRMNAAFENRNATWLRRDGSIYVEERGTTIDSGLLTLTAPGFADSEAGARAAKVKAAAKKL